MNISLIATLLFLAAFLSYGFYIKRKPKSTAKKPFDEMTTLHEMLEVALADIKSLEGIPFYKIDMDTWYERKNNYCKVCLAGSILIKEYDMKFFGEYTPLERNLLQDKNLQERLNTVNCLREGYVLLALAGLLRIYTLYPNYNLCFIKAKEILIKKNVEERYIIYDYASDKEEFYKGMYKLLNTLKEADL